MADIDFDELDKAVSSLMSDAKQPAAGAATMSKPQDTSSDQASEKPSVDEDSVPVSVGENQTDEAVTVDESPEPAAPDAPIAQDSNEGTETPASVDEHPKDTGEVDSSEQGEAPQQKSLATKRRGQFMDMKHPSADMKSSQPVVPASRSGVTIAPLSSAAATPSDEPSKDTSPVSSEEVVSASENKESETSEAEMPEIEVPSIEPDSTPTEATTDAAENHESDASATEVEEAVTSKPAEVEVPKVEPTVTNTEPVTDSSEAAPVSPFLPDAKVEKRPLGSPTQETTEPIAGEEVDNASALPDELHDSVMAVEADTTISKPVSTDTSEQPVDSVLEKADEEEKTEKTPDSPSDSSIPNQYKTPKTDSRTDEKPSETSLYDNGAEHDAFAQSPKHSHWTIILAIIIIIVLGAAIGAGAYVLQAGLI